MRKKGKLRLYAVAAEINGVPEILYLKARSQAHARMQLIRSWNNNLFAGKRVNVVGVALAIGHLVDERSVG